MYTRDIVRAGTRLSYLLNQVVLEPFNIFAENMGEVNTEIRRKYKDGSFSRKAAVVCARAGVWQGRCGLRGDPQRRESATFTTMGASLEGPVFR